MNLSRFFIERPVDTTLLTLAIALLGVAAFFALPVAPLPQADYPVISVNASLPGGSPAVLASSVASPLERRLGAISGVTEMTSSSGNGGTNVSLQFELNRKIDAAAREVQAAINAARADLPLALRSNPSYRKVNPADIAVIVLALTSKTRTPSEIYDSVSSVIQQKLSQVKGVGDVELGGASLPAVRVQLLPFALNRYGISTEDVRAAIQANAANRPKGVIENQDKRYQLYTDTGMTVLDAAAYRELIVAWRHGAPVRLSDVAQVSQSVEDINGIGLINGQPAVLAFVSRQPGANVIEVVDAVKAILPELHAELPPDIDMRISSERTQSIRTSLHEIELTLLISLVLVVLVVSAFLRSARSTLIPFVTIPVSLVGAFFFLYVMGFTVNVLTLLGLVLAIGLVVDDAIVVLENCHRHVEMGKSPMQAAADGAKEIAFAVVAMTMTLAAVFAPLAFMTGNTGKLFTEFALTVAAAVLVSGFVALTLTPMMCSRILQAHASHGRLYALTERFFEAMNRGYRRSLSLALRLRWVVVAAFVLVAAGAVATHQSLKSELSPIEDRGFFITLVLAPEGASLDYTDAYAREVEALYAKVPEIHTYFLAVAPGLERPNPVNFAIAFSQLKPWEERTRKVQQITGELAPKLFMGMPGVLAFPINPPSLGQNFRNPPVQFVVQANSYEDLERMTSQLLAKARQSKVLANPDTDLRLNKPQLSVEIDREKAAGMGIDVETIGRTLETLLGGRQVTRFKREGKQYDVIVQLEAKDRDTPADLAAIFVRARDGRLVQLSNLVRVRETVGPKELNHFNRLRATVLSANVAPGYTLGEALEVLEAAAKETLEPTARTELDGPSREFRESGTTLVLTFLLALAFIYLVLAAQFESFVSPLVIMLTVPLAMTGALLALKFSGGTLNVYSQIGLVMLIGLITKHGILIVEFANQTRERGLAAREAVLEASTLRLRPILMTTGAMVLGAVPLAYATGAGAEARQPIGWVIVGGLLLGTLFTLYVVPVAYVLLARRSPAKHKEAPHEPVPGSAD